MLGDFAGDVSCRFAGANRWNGGCSAGRCDFWNLEINPCVKIAKTTPEHI